MPQPTAHESRTRPPSYPRRGFGSAVQHSLLAIERLYNQHSPFDRGRFLGTRLIRWGVDWLGMDPPVLRSEDGVLMEYSPHVSLDCVMREIVLKGRFEAEQSDRIRNVLKPGGVVLDVGANLGYFSLLASRHAGPEGKVLSFEPVARTFAQLKRNIQINEATNVTPFLLALGAEPGWATMQTFYDSGWSFMRPAERGEDTVEVSTLDHVVSDAQVERIDLLKVDTEGAELEVLRGGRKSIERFRPLILMESTHLHRFGAGVEEVREFLVPLGYRIEALRGEHTEDLQCVPT